MRISQLLKIMSEKDRRKHAGQNEGAGEERRSSAEACRDRSAFLVEVPYKLSH